MIRLALLAAPLAALGIAPVAAQDAPPPGRAFQPPEGCTAYLTVQMASCTLSHHFTCEADPAGWQRRVDMDEGGVSYFGAIDGETQWVESFHVTTEHFERLAPAPADPASFSELLATGRDGYDFTTLSDEIGPTRYVGEDTLPGETVEIDGVTLDRTSYRIVAYDAQGTEVWRSQGSEFVNRDWRMFLSGTGTTKIADAVTADGQFVEGETFEGDDTPVEFVFPDEPGFLSASPKHGCGAMMSKAPR